MEIKNAVKMKILFFFLSISLLSPSISFAETIVLKSGKTIEGKIINRTNEYTEVDFMGVKLKYFNDQIEQIKETKSAADTNAGAPEAPGLISIKIKSSSTDNPKKEGGVEDFIRTLDNINAKIDSIISEGMNKILNKKQEKITEEQLQSLRNIVSATKENIAEVEKLKEPPSCKLLKDTFLQKCKIRINSLEELLKNAPPPNEIAKNLKKQNMEISEISKKYTEERQRILKEHGAKQ